MELDILVSVAFVFIEVEQSTFWPIISFKFSKIDIILCTIILIENNLLEKEIVDLIELEKNSEKMSKLVVYIWL